MAQLLPDDVWERVRPLLPEEPGPRPGRPPLPARRVLTGILFVLKSGLPWEDLPAELGCGSGTSCWRLLAAWRDDGTWADHRVRLPRVTTYTNIRVAFTSYLGVAGTDYSTRDGLTDAADGTSQTLLVGERPPRADFEFGWWYAGIGQRRTGSADLIPGVREQNLQPVIGGSAGGPGGDRFAPAAGFDDPGRMFHFWSPHAGGANLA